MKSLSNKIFVLFPTWCACALFWGALITSCTSEFQEINTNPYAVSDESAIQDFNGLTGPIGQALLNVYTVTPVWKNQLQQNLIGDVFSGYMASPNPFRGNINNMTYFLVDGWNGYPWSIAYEEVMGPLDVMDKRAGSDFPNFVAWGKIIRVLAMHRVSDIYGPIIYSEFGKVPALYDAQNKVYEMFIQDLTSAVSTLKKADEGFVLSKDLTQYAGDVSKWIRFANSLRLRLAIRMSEVAPDKAKTYGEAALADEGGLIEDNGSGAFLSESVGDNPLNTISGPWSDIRMSAEMESFLTGYQDPRIGAYFTKVADEEIKSEYKGIRMGIEMESKNVYVGHSALTRQGAVQFMNAAEVAFLKAEAALRGWAGAGDAKTNYETGISLSFEQHGLAGASDYMANSVLKPAPFVDAVNPDNNIPEDSPLLSKITVAWDDAAGVAENWERIITQKWIAMFPDGQEAWSEHRRTGFPKIFPVVVNDSDGKINTEEQVKRINFPVVESSTNKEGFDSGVKLLEGVDNGGTALWWDKN